MLWWWMLQATPDLGRAVREEVARSLCRGGRTDEIMVCGRRGDSPYRLPGRDAPFNPLAEDAPDSVMRERMRWIEHGDTGIGSCSAVGPGGFTGCMVKQWRQMRDQTQWKSNIPKSP